MKRLLIMLFATICAQQQQAQFVVGWSGGYALCRELNREIYVYNAVNGPNLDKEMQPVHWYQGVLIGFRSPGEGPFVELLYNRKRCKVTSEFDSSGIAMARELKVLCNTYNFGIGYKKNNWAIGLSWDFGRFKGKGRRGPQDAIADMGFERLWVQDRTRLIGIAVARLFCQETIFVERSMGPVGIRAYIQLPGTPNRMDGLDFWLFGQELNYAESQEERFVNFGAAITVTLGKK